MQYDSKEITANWAIENNVIKWLYDNLSSNWDWTFAENTNYIIIRFNNLEDYTAYVLTWEDE